jgi:hypothetical protein
MDFFLVKLKTMCSVNVVLHQFVAVPVKLLAISNEKQLSYT